MTSAQPVMINHNPDQGVVNLEPNQHLQHLENATGLPNTSNDTGTVVPSTGQAVQAMVDPQPQLQQQQQQVEQQVQQQQLLGQHAGGAHEQHVNSVPVTVAVPADDGHLNNTQPLPEQQPLAAVTTSHPLTGMNANQGVQLVRSKSAPPGNVQHIALPPTTTTTTTSIPTAVPPTASVHTELPPTPSTPAASGIPSRGPIPTRGPKGDEAPPINIPPFNLPPFNMAVPNGQAQ